MSIIQSVGQWFLRIHWPNRSRHPLACGLDYEQTWAARHLGLNIGHSCRVFGRLPVLLLFAACRFKLGPQWQGSLVLPKGLRY